MVRRWLIALLFASLTASLVFSFAHRIEPVVDADAYDAIALNLAAGEGFKEERNQKYEFDPSIIRAGPGYEFFLAGLYTVFGHRYEPVWVAQAILHVLTALLVFLIAREVWREQGERVGLVAAAIMGLHPDLIEIAGMLMTETLYLFFVTLTVYVFVRAYRRPEQWTAGALLGLTAGLAVLTRPTVLFFLPIFLIFYLRSRRWWPALAMLAALALALTPWTARNYTIYHQFIPTTLVGSYNLWVGNTLLSDGGQIAGGFNALTTYTAEHGFFGLKAKASAEFVNFITTHPLVFIRLCVVRVIRFFSLIRPMGFWFYQSGLPQLVWVGLSASAIAGLFMAGFAGLAQLVRERKEFFYYFAALAVTALIALVPTVVQSRYRFQIYPFLAIAAGYALVGQAKGWWRRTAAFWVPAGGLVLITAIDAVMQWPTIVQRLGSFF